MLETEPGFWTYPELNPWMLTVLGLESAFCIDPKMGFGFWIGAEPDSAFLEKFRDKPWSLDSSGNGPWRLSNSGVGAWPLDSWRLRPTFWTGPERHSSFETVLEPGVTLQISKKQTVSFGHLRRLIPILGPEGGSLIVLECYYPFNSLTFYEYQKLMMAYPRPFCWHIERKRVGKRPSMIH